MRQQSPVSLLLIGMVLLAICGQTVVMKSYLSVPTSELSDKLDAIKGGTDRIEMLVQLKVSDSAQQEIERLIKHAKH